MLKEQKYSSKLGTASRHPKPQRWGSCSSHHIHYGMVGTACTGGQLEEVEAQPAVPCARTEAIDGWRNTKEPHAKQGSTSQWLPAVAIDPFVSVKCPDQSNFRKKGFVLAYSLRLQSTTAGISKK